MANGAAPTFTHVCIPVRDLNDSIAFYEQWGQLKMIDRVPSTTGADVARFTDEAESLILVLAETPDLRFRMAGRAHIGLECSSKEQVDDAAQQARAHGVLVGGPVESPPPVGYHAFFVDPDGHQLELAYGQDVGVASAKLA